MGEDTPRARLLGMLKLERGLDTDAIAKLCDGARFAPEPLERYRARKRSSGSLDNAPAFVAGDYPEWLDDEFANIFGDERVEEGAGLSRRAPLDLRVNTLKGEPRRQCSVRCAISARRQRTWSPMGLRIELAADARIARHPGRAGFHQGPHRSAGRRLAARRAVLRRRSRARP